MLKKDTIKKLKDLGFDFAKLEAAIKAEDEQDFEVPAINNLTDEQLTERDKQVISAAKPDILKEAKQTGIEIANKAIIKKFGLSDIDAKDVDKVIAALDATVAKGDQGLKEQVALLLKDKETLNTQIEQEKQTATTIKRDFGLIKHFPSNRLALLDDDDYLTKIKKDYQFEEVDGILAVKKNGAVLRDPKTQSPIPVKDAIASFFTEHKFVENGKAGGRGGDDKQAQGSGVKKLSQVREEWVKNGKNILSPEFSNHVAEIAAETTDFDWQN